MLYEPVFFGAHRLEMLQTTGNQATRDIVKTQKIPTAAVAFQSGFRLSDAGAWGFRMRLQSFG